MRDDDGWTPIVRALSLTGYLGFLMAGSVFAGLFLGWCLDKLVGTKSLFKIIFIVLGVGGGFMNVYKAVSRAIR